MRPSATSTAPGRKTAPCSSQVTTASAAKRPAVDVTPVSRLCSETQSENGLGTCASGERLPATQERTLCLRQRVDPHAERLQLPPRDLLVELGRERMHARLEL